MEKLLTQLERALIILASLVILEAFGLVALAYKVSQKQTSKPDQMIHLTVTNAGNFSLKLDGGEDYPLTVTNSDGWIGPNKKKMPAGWTIVQDDKGNYGAVRPAPLSELILQTTTDGRPLRSLTQVIERAWEQVEWEAPSGYWKNRWKPVPSLQTSTYDKTMQMYGTEGKPH